MKEVDLKLKDTFVHLFVPAPYKTTPDSHVVNIVRVEKLNHGLVGNYASIP